MSQHSNSSEANHNNNNTIITTPKKGKSESPQINPNRSPSPTPHKHKETDILSLQKELQDKQHELTIAYQTSLELVETNTELQQQLEEQTITIQQLDASITDYEMKVQLQNNI